MGTELLYCCGIRLERTDAYTWQGTIYQPYFGVKEFNSIMGMFVVMEQQLNQLHNSLTGNTNFCSPVTVKPEITPVNAGLSFQIDVVSRQNFTWQGVLYCSAREFRKSFRRTSELLKYIEELLMEAGDEKGSVFR